MNENQQPPYLKQAIVDGLVKFTGEGKTERIHYVAAAHSERWADPEEKVRAEFWAELIYKYEYLPERIRLEVKVPRRTPNDLADLVIYGDKDDELKAPYFVFECKRADVSDAEFAQSIEQACGNRGNLAAYFCGAIAGLTRRFLRFDKFPPGERDKNILPDIPVRYGKLPDWRFYKNVAGHDLAAVPREELRAAIRKCHQTLWEGGRRSPIAAFGEFCKIIFVKHRDEKNSDRKDGEPYTFQRRREETAEELAVRIHKLYTYEQELEPDVFTDKINVEPPVLAHVVEHLEGISLDRTELDTKGVAFEEFMGGFFKGDFGQYFTPRELIGFAVEVLNPERKQLILDPACGSGGFLLYALDHVRREADRRFPKHLTDPKQRLDHWTYWHDFAEKNLFGIEINEELARVAKMNMIIHDDGHTNIVGHDALDFFVRPRDSKGEPKGENRSYLYDRNKTLREDKFDLILTNPPFGSVVKRAEKGEGYLEQFDLRNYIAKSTSNSEPEDSGKGAADAKSGTKAVKERASIKTEILFLERVHSFLKPGSGRVGIVLPDGILTNSSLQGVRDWLLAHFQLLAVVSLPQFAFAHYDAGVKASLVFLRRLKDGEIVPDDAPIFMALAENIGYDATGRKTFEVTLEKEVPAVEKIERLHCDLFDLRAYYEWSTTNPKKPAWSERHREIIADTGLVAQWRSFQKTPAPFFNRNPVADGKARCFGVRRGEISGRVDVVFHQPWIRSRIALLDIAKFPARDLGSVIQEIRYGTGTPPPYLEPGPDTVPFVRATDIKEGEVVKSTLLYIAQEQPKAMEKCRLAGGELIIVRSGVNTGDCAVIPADLAGAYAAYDLIVTFRPDVSAHFVSAFLDTELGRLQLNLVRGRAAQPHINAEEVAALHIPIPPLEVQKDVVVRLNAERKKAEALRAEAEAGWQTAKRWFEEQLVGAPLP